MDSLKNKFFKDYDRLSRYASFPCYYNSLDDKYVTGSISPLSKDCLYSTYKVNVDETYDLIALKAYNNPTYYWIICDFNDIIDSLEPPVPGTYLKIPLLSQIKFTS